MANSGRCPHCEIVISNVRLERVVVGLGPGLTTPSGSSQFHGVSFVCSACSKVLSVELDPFALQSDAVSEIEDAIRQHLD